METAAAAGAARRGRQGFSGLSAGESVGDPVCVARPGPRFSPREGKGCRSGSLEGTGIPKSLPPLSARWKAPSGRRVRPE